MRWGADSLMNSLTTPMSGAEGSPKFYIQHQRRSRLELGRGKERGVCGGGIVGCGLVIARQQVAKASSIRHRPPQIANTHLAGKLGKNNRLSES